MPSFFDTLNGALTTPLSTEGRAAFLPYKRTPNGNELAIPGILASAFNAFTAPRRSMRGILTADEDGNIIPSFDAPAEAQNVALNMFGFGGTFGGAPGNSLGTVKGFFKGSPPPQHQGALEIPINEAGNFTILPSKKSAFYNNGDMYATYRKTASGDYVAEVAPPWGSKSKTFYGLGDNLEELAKATVDRINRSDKAVSVSGRLKDEASLLGRLKKEFGDNFKVSKSERSQSQYITHIPSGQKIRISDHDLPLGYEQPDLDLRSSIPIDEQLHAIKQFLGN